VAHSLWKRSNVTITPPSSGNACPSGMKMKRSWTNFPSLISGMHLFPVDHVLERRHADAAIGFEQAFARLAQLHIRIDHAFDGIDDLVLAESRPHDLAHARIFRARSAELDLVEFDALLVDAENADVTGMMMPAGIDAAAHLDLDLTEVVLAFEIGEAFLDRNRNRTRIRQIAIVQAGAADDVGNEPRIRRAEVQRLQPREHRGQVFLAHMREHEVLLVAHAHFGETEIVHDLRYAIHLVGADVARRHADVLERDRGDGIAARAMRRDV